MVVLFFSNINNAYSEAVSGGTVHLHPPQNLSPSVLGGICLFQENFIDKYTTDVSTVNETKLEFRKDNLIGSYCKIYLKFPVTDKFKNAGIYKDSLIFPNCSYLIKAELYIPEKANFHMYPQIVIFDKNWKVIAVSEQKINSNSDGWSNLVFNFSIQGNEVKRVHIGVSAQFGRTSNENECEYYVKGLEIYQRDELIPEKNYEYITNKSNKFICLWEDFNFNDMNKLSTLNSIASNYIYYVSNIDKLSSKSVNRYLHRLNPNIKIFAYFNAEALHSSSKLIEYIAVHHPEWMIKDRNNNFVEERDYPGNRIMDITIT